MDRPAEPMAAWRQWMDAEADYAQRVSKKFTDASQAAYFHEGITTGRFPWADSAVGYLRRALQRRPAFHDSAAVRLRAVQEVGKSAFNHTALGAVALWQWGRAHSLPDAIRYNLDMLGADIPAGLSPGDDELCLSGLDPLTIDRHYAGFRDLQEYWEAGSRDEFFVKLNNLSLTVHRAFIRSATQHGWPSPGRSSSDDVAEWLQSSD